ncbi:unnamed protein product [Allacma fusca]|uniref:Uncharacterized protein n=1 Tax=Allacma fusca TaxID=39272 RepID=A0A8J2JDY6_9HEXA|nr:unnamed protein product [Allacma fusca]
MANQHQPGGFSVPEAPPAYFPPVVSQPGGMMNSESYPMPYISSSGVPGVHPGHTGPLAPAPYQNQAVYPEQNLERVYALEIVPEPPNPLPTILAREAKLSFRTNQRIARGQNSLMIQILGTQNQLVMSTILVTVGVPTAVATNGYAVNRVITEPRSTMIFNDPTGRNLMKCKQFENELHVTQDDEFLGAIRADLTCCNRFLVNSPSSFHAESGNGELYFETKNKDSEYYFVRNGTKIAAARKGVISSDDFGVEFLGTVDAPTKAMIMAVSLNLFVLHYAERSGGCSIL